MNSQKVIFGVSILLLVNGCATTSYRSDRVWAGAGIGLVAGSVGGAALSPNDESRGLNALVFGLSGALLGGIVGAVTGSDPTTKSETPTLEEREMKGASTQKEIVIGPTGDLPDFLKHRVSPAVVEEYMEQDQVGEDGSLHAPHRVYRIKRQAELIARPTDTGAEKTK